MIDETLLPRMRELASALGSSMSLFDPPIADDAVRAFERTNGIELPVDYRQFLTEIASGGPGPSNGLISFGHGVVDDRLSQPWIDPVRWNETDGDYDDDDSGGVYQGVLAVADLGCGSLALLVLVGPHRGEIWNDLTAGAEDYQRVAGSFGEWYGRWVDDELARAQDAPRLEAEKLDSAASAADADPENWELLRTALYVLGPAGDPRFERFLERASDLNCVSPTSVDSIVDYALDLSLGELAERMLDRRLQDCELGETTFRCLRALVRAHNGDTEAALADWSTAQSAADFDPPRGCARKLALLLLRSGDLDAAMSVYFADEGLVTGPPTEVATEAVARGEAELAVAWCEDLVRRVSALEPPEPDDDDEDDEWDDDDDEIGELLADAHSALALALLHAGRSSEADEHLKAAESFGAYVNWQALALAACEGREFETSLRFLERCTSHPWWIANLRGCCLQGLDRLEEALASFDASLAIRNWLVPFENRAYALIRLGRFDAARQVLDEVERFDPEFPWTHYHRATLFAREGDAAAARAAFDHALALGFDREAASAEPSLVELGLVP